MDVPSLPYSAPVDVATFGASDFDGYSCAPDVDATGPEVAYRVHVDEEALLAASASDGASVFLLGSTDPESCIVGGKQRLASWVAPGTHYLVFEAGSSADPTISLAATTPSFLAGVGMSADVARSGLRAFSVAWSHGDTDRLDYAMTDFSLSSALEREWIVDLGKTELLWKLFVAHGWGSADPDDPSRAVVFSDTPDSHMSSLGMVRTAEPYVGDYGQSHRLDGLEPGFNAKVRERDIVVHPWDESREEYVQANGMTGPTWGCPAIDDRIASDVVARMSGGALMWFWFPDSAWLASSPYLK